MWKQILIMAFVLAALIAWDRSLTERTTRAREASVRVETLLADPDAVFSADRPVAAFRVEQGDFGSLDPRNRTVHLYVHADGVWRCSTAYGAIALNEHLELLLPKLMSAEGYVHTKVAAAAREFGFDSDEMLRLVACGPEVLSDPAGDVVYSLDIGRSIPHIGGSYVRPTGTTDIWAVNVDFREELESPVGPAVPPMLDPRIVPESWPGFAPPGVDRIVVEVQDEPPLELQRHDRELTPEQIAAGEPAWEWSVKKGDHEYIGDSFQIFSYGGFLTQAPYAGILSPHAQRDLGFDQITGRITFRSVHGLHMQLLIGRQAPRGGVPVLNTFSQSIFEVDPAIAELLIPDMDLLLLDHLGNPWEQFLRRADER